MPWWRSGLVHRPRGRALDLYGGVGLLAAVLADDVGRSGSVTVVEADRRAVADGRAALSDLPQIAWRHGRVECRAAAAAVGARTSSSPTRRAAGWVGRSSTGSPATSRPGSSTCPATRPPWPGISRCFARHGYRLRALRAFDAFPMTHHVECVALLAAH